MHWGSFALGIGAGIVAAVVTWCVIFVRLMMEGDQ